MKIGVIGYGYWGPNLMRNLAEIADVELCWCADVRPNRLALAKKRHPGLQITTDATAVVGDPQVEAVVIATPVTTHYPLAKQALQAGKHVLVEKPITHTSAQAEELIELAGRKGVVLMVDHTFIYTGAVRKMKEIIAAGELGELHYLDSVRINLGLFQHDIDVLWDLAAHDLAIFDHVIGEPPQFVSAIGSDHTGSGFCDVAYVTLQFASNFLGHLHVNWLSPVKIRQMLIGGSRQMLVYDDMETTEKIRVYDRGIRVTGEDSLYRTLVDYRTGDMWAPKLDNREALAVECEHFVECIRTGREPLSSAAAGLRVVRLLELASRSLAIGGNKVAV
ncbi:MAG TPA: Gfo/Idh/MocA family oxidoreductase [Terriglobales bacterium]|nr:Gfo/Idh/MocA family oxidoreductase [Terriglobales bacterium]